MRLSEDHWVLGTSENPKWVHPLEAIRNQNAFWAPDFFLKEAKAAFVPEALEHLSTKALRERWRELFPESLDSKPTLNLNWKMAEPQELNKQIHELQFLFQTQILKKAVPIVVDVAQMQGLRETLEKHILYFLNQLTTLPTSLTPYGLIHEQWLLGATPETLIEKHRDHAVTHALAGTTPDLSYALLEDPKERLEHQYVIEDLKRQLSEFGSVQVGGTSEKVLPKLKHLVTPIEIHNCKHGLAQMALKLHPTPALGGTPKAAALEWLARQKSADRRLRFGAPFGYWDSKGDGKILVAIRNIQVVNEELRLMAGCGIVPQSQPEREWIEVTAKKNSVRSIWEGL